MLRCLPFYRSHAIPCEALAAQACFPLAGALRRHLTHTLKLVVRAILWDLPISDACRHPTPWWHMPYRRGWALSHYLLTEQDCRGREAITSTRTLRPCGWRRRTTSICWRRKEEIRVASSGGLRGGDDSFTVPYTRISFSFSGTCFSRLSRNSILYQARTCTAPKALSSLGLGREGVLWKHSMRRQMMDQSLLYHAAAYTVTAWEENGLLTLGKVHGAGGMKAVDCCLPGGSTLWAHYKPLHYGENGLCISS